MLTPVSFVLAIGWVLEVRTPPGFVLCIELIWVLTDFGGLGLQYAVRPSEVARTSAHTAQVPLTAPVTGRVFPDNQHRYIFISLPEPEHHAPKTNSCDPDKEPAAPG